MKGPGVSKVVKGIGSEGVWGQLEAKQCFRGQSFWGVWSGTGSDIRVGRRIGGGGGGVISVFGERSASVGEVFIFAGGWALGYHSMGFQRFPGIS